MSFFTDALGAGGFEVLQGGLSNQVDHLAVASSTTTPGIPAVVVELDDGLGGTQTVIRLTGGAAKNLKVTVRQADLPTVEEGDGIIFGGVEYRVIERTDLQGALWELQCTVPRVT